MYWKNQQQSNQRDMRKIPVIWQFFEANSPQGHFCDKTKKKFLDIVLGSVCTKFQVCIVFR